MSYDKYLWFWWKEFSLFVIFHLLGRKYWDKRAFIILEFIGLYCLFILERKTILTPGSGNMTEPSGQMCGGKNLNEKDSDCFSGVFFQKMISLHVHGIHTLLPPWSSSWLSPCQAIRPWESHLSFGFSICKMRDWSCDPRDFIFNGCNCYFLKNCGSFLYIMLTKWISHKTPEIQKV